METGIGSSPELMNLLIGVVNDHPELYYARTGCSFYLDESLTKVTIVMPKYIDDASLDDTKFQRGAQAALSSVKPGMTDLEKAIALHDYLVLNCEYDEERLNNNTLPQASYSAYGVLANRIAVCQGYALAYKYLLNRVGIECYMVSSDAMNHAWNLIKLGDSYYQVDVTWDDPIADRFGLVGHNNMFVSDAAFEAERPGSSHTHYDWVVTTGSSQEGLSATETQYDKAFWVDVISPFVFDEHECYYIDSAAGVVKRKTLSADVQEEICAIGQWKVLDQPEFAYDKKFSGLFQLGDRLYFNSQDEICSVLLNGNDKKSVRVSTTTPTVRKVFGCAYVDGKVKYVLQDKPGGSNKEILEIELSEKYYNVYFNMQGQGTAPSAYTGISAGSTISKPADPTAAGYDFGGWYKDAVCTEPWNFDTDKVDADLTLYAKWTLRGDTTLENAEISFVDAGENYRISYKNGKLTVVSEYASFTVAFDMQGHGIAPASYVVSGGSTIAMPPEKERRGTGPGRILRRDFLTWRSSARAITRLWRK